MSFKIYRANPEQANQLSDLAYRSKAYWGYSQTFMAACRDELSYTEDQILNSHCYVAADEKQIVGFYMLIEHPNDVVELDALFVDPSAINSGYGRKLIEHAKALARTICAEKMIIQGDPNAFDFYLAMGAKKIGTRPSESIIGRDLPLFEILL